MRHKLPNLFDRIPAPMPKNFDIHARASALGDIRKPWEPLLNSKEYSITYETSNGLVFTSEDCHLTKLHIFYRINKPSTRDYDQGIINFFCFFMKTVHPHLNSFYGTDCIELIRHNKEYKVEEK